MEPHARHHRIAIIGAGAAGLSAAQRLRDLGYRHITIYEKEERVGGKVLSYHYKGRVYELGAIWSSGRYRTINRLARRFKQKTVGVRLPDILEKGRIFSYRRYFQTHHGLRATLQAFLRLLRIYFRYPTIRRTGRAAADPATRLPFQQFAQREGIAPLAQTSASFLSGCGYGHVESTSALSAMKLVFLMVDVLVPDMLGISRKRTRVFENGWQLLFETMAKQFDVRLSSPVSEVRRFEVDGKDQIEIVAHGKAEVYDRLIVAAPLPAPVNPLRLTEEEKALFAHVRLKKFRVTLVEGERLVHASLADHATERTLGHINLIAHYHADTNVYTIYQQLDDAMTEEQADALLYEDVARIGGKITAVITRRTWAYFPHVSEQDDQRFFERIESMQGLHGCYFVGGLMNFETVEHTARYSVDLIDRHFA